MFQVQIDITIPLASALAAGSLIGLERSFHGRPAGFRTHALVCLASALLMVVAVHQWQWFTATPPEAIRIDPTRMAQGIMTGIGFLGAGVIFKEKLTVRGLTTAASIWITAALGILYGVGFYYPAVLGTVATLGVLGAFRWLESHLPSQYFADLRVRYARDGAPREVDLRELLSAHKFHVSTMTYRLEDEGRAFEYQAAIRTLDRTNAEALAADLMRRAEVIDFSILPSVN